MDFEVSAVAGSVSFIQSPVPAEVPAPTDWFRRGASLEQTDLAAAEDAYRRAIALEPAQVEPYLNLGAVLCEAGRCSEAVALYEQAVAVVGSDPLIHFNHAIALEDQGRPDQAIAAYVRALRLNERFGDAHYNLGVLMERLGDARGALRHFNAYRRLERSKGS
jgi:tetratricopeptide (TPR) repeat protein